MSERADRRGDATTVGADARYRAFVMDHTVAARPDAVPEITLRLATEVTPLWTASAADLEDAEIEPPFWAFAWAGGAALARWVLDHPERVRGKVVLDLGAGSGLVGIAAKMSGAARVIASDVDPVALVASALNANANGVDLETDGRDRLDDVDAGVDVVLVGDLFYDASIGPRVLAALERWTSPRPTTHGDSPKTISLRESVFGESPWVVEAYVGDPGRGYLPEAAHLVQLAASELRTSVDLESASSKRVAVYRFVASAR